VKFEEYNIDRSIGILEDAISVKINNENLKPNWVEHPAEYTEFYINRNKKNLLVVIGESWTYGETLRGIATGIRQYNFSAQLRYTIGSRMATALDSDLYQYAVPGNCNFYMFTELERILEYVSTLGYEKIYVSLQMTEPSRETPILQAVENAKHSLMDIINTKEKILIQDWLEKYDDVFFDQYDQIISKYNNLEPILWKNFCRINSKNVNRKFKIIGTTWIEHSSRMLARNLKAPSFYAVGWVHHIMNETPRFKHIIIDNEYLMKELDLIEASNQFIKANPLHSHHPNEFGHLLWAQFLLRKSEWINDI